MSVSNLNISRTNKTDSVCFGEAFYKPGGVCGWRAQPELQLVMIHRGQMEVYLDDDPPFIVKSGQCILLKPRPKELLVFDRNGPTHHTWLAISPFLWPKQAEKTPVQTTPSTVSALIQLAMRENQTPVIEALAIATLESYFAPSEVQKQSIVMQATQFISERLSQPLSVNDIADATFISAQHLTRLFKAELGKTPANYLWEQRTLRGIELLRSTGLSISEISHQMGFQSPFHFSRLVKGVTGVPPRQLRADSWQIDQ